MSETMDFETGIAHAEAYAAEYTRARESLPGPGWQDHERIPIVAFDACRAGYLKALEQHPAPAPAAQTVIYCRVCGRTQAHPIHHFSHREEHHPYAVGPDAAQLARRVRELEERLALVTEAAKEAQCSCSVAERASGHFVGCWMPALRAALKDPSNG